MERLTGRPWWTCHRCHDRWTHIPRDRCDSLLALLEAEEQAGWTTVTPIRGDIHALLSYPQAPVRNVEKRIAS